MVKRDDAWPIAMKVGAGLGHPGRHQPQGPSIRSDDCIRIAGVFLFPPRRTLMDLHGQSCCILFPFVDILKLLLW